MAVVREAAGQATPAFNRRPTRPTCPPRSSRRAWPPSLGEGEAMHGSRGSRRRRPSAPTAALARYRVESGCSAGGTSSPACPPSSAEKSGFFFLPAVAWGPPIAHCPSKIAPSCTTSRGLEMLPTTLAVACSSSSERAAMSPVTCPCTTTEAPLIFAFSRALSPMVRVSSELISPSTWPSMRTAPSKASFPFTRLPLPRNALVPGVSWGWVFSRSNIFTSWGAGVSGAGAATAAGRLLRRRPPHGRHHLAHELLPLRGGPVAEGEEDGLLDLRRVAADALAVARDHLDQRPHLVGARAGVPHVGVPGDDAEEDFLPRAT